jgi:aminopeptidase-like protein/aminoglycoside N3'-acetyltransferase
MQTGVTAQMNKARELAALENIDDVDGNYSQSDLIDSLRKSGIGLGDVVYTVVNLPKLGKMKGCRTTEEQGQCLLKALQESVGPGGTILVPTYTFSFCRGETFDVQSSPAVKGPWSPSTEFLEYFRLLPGAIRSADPIHSVAGIGPRAAEILSNVPPTCFGEDSVPYRLRRIGAKVCAIGVGLHESNFQHHVEETLGVPFRFKKLFTGYIRNHGVTEKKGWIYNVGILAKNGSLDEHRLEDSARKCGVCRAVPVGRGEILGADLQELFDFTLQGLSKDPWLTAQGPAGDPVELERLRVNGPRYEVELPSSASISEMIQALWKLPRNIVSEGYDVALSALAAQVPMKINEYPTGMDCWSWIIPEKWTCYEAYLESLDGRRLFSYADNPLHVVSYSLPFEGEVSRGDLFEHLHVHGKIPDAIPFIFKYYERDWGLCCSKTLRDTLHDDRYKVVIKSDFSFSTLKVGEVVASGKTDDCIVLCAHLCHPGMVNDDLSGVVVGIKVMQALMSRSDLRYTYRFIIVPETIGSVAYLSQNDKLIPKMKGGLFLEMLGLDNPHALQLSFAGDSDVDLCFSKALKDHDPFGWTGAYRAIIGNDERQFNGPGVRVPMLSLSRVLPPTKADWPYREYHSSYDIPSVTSVKSLDASCDMVLSMIDTFENNRVPVNRYKGEVFCSRYGMFFDPSSDPESYRALFDVMDLIDGTHSVTQIANRCGISFETTTKIINELHAQGLVD